MQSKKQTEIPAGVAITRCPPRAAQGLSEFRPTMKATGGSRMPPATKAEAARIGLAVAAYKASGGNIKAALIAFNAAKAGR